MTNKRLYEIMNSLGMIGEEDGDIESSDMRSDVERFEQDIASELVHTINFVDSLTTYNDLNTFGKLLVVLISEMAEDKDND